jgi:hypothetical protein
MIRGALIALAAACVASGALAAEFFVGGRSLASELLVSKTQIGILKADDKADGNCDQRRFLNARVLSDPVIVPAGGASERKWKEYWTLERCGAKIGYFVYFTEVGSGGAYFSFVNSK